MGKTSKSPIENSNCPFLSGAAKGPSGSLSLNVHVRPGASADRIDGLYGKALKIRLSAPALDGKANRALVKFLAELLGVKKSEVVLTKGEKSRAKRLLISGVGLKKAREIIAGKLAR